MVPPIWWHASASGWRVRDGNPVSPPMQVFDAASRALEDYKINYLAQPWNNPKIGTSFRWRMARSPATGLPAYLRGQSAGAPVALSDARDKSRDWLSEASLARTLMGIQIDMDAAEVVTNSFPVDVEPRITTRRWQGRGCRQCAELLCAETTLPCAINNGMANGQFSAVRSVVHMTEGDVRTSCTNSYFPIPDDKEPKTYADSRAIGAEKAISRLGALSSTTSLQRLRRIPTGKSRTRPRTCALETGSFSSRSAASRLAG